MAEEKTPSVTAHTSNLNFLSHPEVEEQQAEVDRVLACITRPSLERLCEVLKFALVDFSFLPEGEPGCHFGRLFNVNPNWVLHVRPLESENTTKDQKLFLQVTNPHSGRAGRNTRNKVGAMLWLRQHDVPLVPAVVSWSADPLTSPLGCEYVLMERIPGVPLHQVWPNLSAEERGQYRQQLATWLQTVAGVPRPPAESTGPLGFTVEEERQTETVSCNAPGGCNNPPLPLGEGYADFARAVVDDAIARIMSQSGSIVGPRVPSHCDTRPQSGVTEAHAALSADQGRLSLLPELRRVLQCIEEYRERYEGTPEKRESSSGSYGVCHGDLHLGNVLCDPPRSLLTGVVDWENVSWGPREADLIQLDNSFAVREEEAEGLAKGPEEEKEKETPVPPLAGVGPVESLTSGRGALERALLFPLLEDVCFLHFFTVTWWGHLDTLEKKKVAAEEEGQNAVSSLRTRLDTFFADWESWVRSQFKAPV
uniref:Aminoglycoside phosphotransferase domain-containing protein n=1 Tax=Chromera velia CCMP2878 TaxID=1169474 RepID=A0A0G4HWZ6_9ALVE|eukprot:Cvel_9144.t1-p1 / transcript=Cvel_9144.t1 / gene=Cvel_9144 / organism=Chromera_velia_CCMP2878 / gene_product=hypothetical protein / transcript_product=hypothetical protein / location=Cvel_scaffold520:46351-47787(-) / protein_length=479 / sequence_SO=supercontig / SO=protein_coding / is_pseudo=false